MAGSKDGTEDRNITDADRQCPQMTTYRERVQNKLSLHPGEVVGKQWKVLRFIESKKNLAALKIEKKNDPVPMLQFELFILLKVEQSKKCKQFCKVLGKGNEGDYNWITISLCGKNLRALRKAQPNGKLSLACGLSVAQQCLKGIEELHKIGFIHRNVAPSTFAIGKYEGEHSAAELRNIYVLDIGFAHQYVKPDGTLKQPSPKPWKYVGPIRHMSRNAYMGNELARSDDIEMWYYMTVELIKGGLPWAHLRDAKLVFEYQKACRNGLALRELLGGLPAEFVDIMKEIDKLSYKDAPNYTEIYGLLTNAILFSGKSEFPYDWEAQEVEEFKNPPAAEEKKEGDEKK
ncbi:unnamed protein product [Caenorhabditis auriculariae]|uniref:Protein kinase domain-containing protein n=1 Tax=Caenorhabditis auriculariae TaxID=2777116 RepID=A0A8S1HDP3_9PELO|nr:unnamed protein product [Caenorhabditis auriculariae]